ncbi:heme-binding protein soul2 [Epinephelus moara]|uniref:heme-binding protein soul2 n=1 Tax=Epinephelus moara TaxID=300413 RepID=UPI00214E5670|nr:heme-binding protein soul2 [Epinephelus moara]
MELRLFLLLPLVVFCRGQSWRPPEYCHDLPCPKFTSLKTSVKDVEEHLLGDTEWISTTMKNPTPSDLMAARERLSKVTGYVDSWPVLVNVTNGKILALSWFVAPGSVAEISDSEVRLERGPKFVYVRSSHYFPTLEKGQEDKRALCDDLCEGGKTCTDDQTYFVAVYDSVFSGEHYSEIWIEKTP